MHTRLMESWIASHGEAILAELTKLLSVYTAEAHITNEVAQNTCTDAAV